MNKHPVLPPPTPEELAAQAAPLTGRDPLKVPIEDIKLPPAHLIDQLDNSAAELEAAEPEAEIATLDFVGDELPFRDIPLRFAFIWDGARVDTIRVSQLTTGRLGSLVGELQRRPNRRMELMDVYAVMTGLPAKVLRALPSEDGDKVVDAAFGFLPPSLRPADG